MVVRDFRMEGDIFISFVVQYEMFVFFTTYDDAIKRAMVHL